MNVPIFQKTKDLDFSHIERKKHWNMNYPHYHDGYELYFQTEGTRKIFFRHNQYLLQPGTLCIITPHILHSTQNSGENQLYSRYLINFSPKIFYEFLSENEMESFFDELPPCLLQLDKDQSSMLLEHINNIYDYWDMHLHNIPRGKKLAYMEVYRIVDHLIRLIQNSKDISKLTDVPVVSDSEIYNVLYYIEHHYNEDIQIDDMVQLSHMSKANFYRTFKQITGDSFNHYLNRFRAVKAHALIIQNKLSLQKISEKTGFSSTAHMTRIFREIHGISPSEYRRRNK